MSVHEKKKIMRNMYLLTDPELVVMFGQIIYDSEPEIMQEVSNNSISVNLDEASKELISNLWKFMQVNLLL